MGHQSPIQLRLATVGSIGIGVVRWVPDAEQTLRRQFGKNNRGSGEF